MTSPLRYDLKIITEISVLYCISNIKNFSIIISVLHTIKGKKLCCSSTVHLAEGFSDLIELGSWYCKAFFVQRIDDVFRILAGVLEELIEGALGYEIQLPCLQIRGTQMKIKLAWTMISMRMGKKVKGSCCAPGTSLYLPNFVRCLPLCLLSFQCLARALPCAMFSSSLRKHSTDGSLKANQHAVWQ